MTRFLRYGVAMIGRLLKIINLFCKKALCKRRYFAKETYFEEPTNRSHPISAHSDHYQYVCVCARVCVCVCVCIYI